MSEALEVFDQEALAQQCSAKERAFVREYVVDLNGLQAVLRAGCFNIGSYEAAGVAAARLLKRDRVVALVAITKAQRASRTQLTADSVLSEMALLAQSDLSHYVIDDNGNVQLTAGAPEGAMRAIQRVKRRKTIREDKEGNVTITYDVEITLWDKPAPLKLMGRHVGLFPDKVEITGRNGGPIELTALSDAQLAERLAATAEEARKLAEVSAPKAIDGQFTETPSGVQTE